MNTKITNGFWHERLEINARRAIFHQWDQLEASGCIENFRIAAGDVEGIRIGWFFADSDAYKWLEAAARIYASYPNPQLAALMDKLILLLARAQQPDGYIFTYNQIHFPNTRWVNLQIEHELYCHGHLIEAGVSHHMATGRADLLNIACHAADRIVHDFRGKGTRYTPGHEEIEIALLRLYQVTHHQSYLDMARQFIEQRGRDPLFILSILKQNSSAGARRKLIEQKKQAYVTAHPEFKPFQLPPDNDSIQPWNSAIRRYTSALSGKYLQQHTVIRKQTVPVGHSVRFGYLETAVAMLARESGDTTLIPVLERVWERMVTRRMYVTGGLGSVPRIEGFGNDYELDPEYAYAETCASLASLFWNWEMSQLTGAAKYSDLFEWQLYNAAAVGMGMDGSTYLYNNPLTCHGGVNRKTWYSVPCCPSNISRTWADLGKYICSTKDNILTVHQYISSEVQNQVLTSQDGRQINISLAMESGFPYDGKVGFKITALSTSFGQTNALFTLQSRHPSWAGRSHIHVNGIEERYDPVTSTAGTDPAASGFDPRAAGYLLLHRRWSTGDEIMIEFDMSIVARRAHSKVKGHRGKVAITRGPLVYCLESVDNPGIDIFTVRVDMNSLEPMRTQTDLGEVLMLKGRSTTGYPLTLIPYLLWGNRGGSQVTVWVNE